MRLAIRSAAPSSASAVQDRVATDQTIQALMGRDVSPHFEFIMQRAPKVEELDV